MESIGSLLQNIAKYSDYVVIISVNSYHDISLTANMTWESISNASNGVIEAKRPILDRQCTRLCAYVTANFKCVFLRLKLSTLGMFNVQ